MIGSDDPDVARQVAGRFARRERARDRGERIGRGVGRLVLVSFPVWAVVVAHQAWRLASWVWGWS